MQELENPEKANLKFNKLYSTFFMYFNLNSLKIYKCIIKSNLYILVNIFHVF